MAKDGSSLVTELALDPLRRAAGVTALDSATDETGAARVVVVWRARFGIGSEATLSADASAIDAEAVSRRCSFTFGVERGAASGAL